MQALLRRSMIVLTLCAPHVDAHHSYAMFDMTQSVRISGTMAKIDWSNPHISIWLYVSNKQSDSGYELYAFESGGANFMMRRGWNKDMLPTGEKVTVEYFPLKDGRNGGALMKIIRADGSAIMGDPSTSAPRPAGGPKP